MQCHKGFGPIMNIVAVRSVQYYFKNTLGRFVDKMMNFVGADHNALTKEKHTWSSLRIGERKKILAKEQVLSYFT